MTYRISWLKRDLKTMDLFALGYSDVSSTYYFTLGVVALCSGSLLPITMLLGSLSMWLVGLAYAEFGSAIPRSGGAYYYIKRELGDFWGFVAGWLLSFDQILMIAYGSLGTVGYLNGILRNAIRWPMNSILSIAIIMALMVINILGIKLSARFNLALLVIDLTSIVLLIILGYYILIINRKSLVIPTIAINSHFILNGLAYSLRGYTGIDVIAQVTGETIAPAISIPRSILTIASTSTAIALLLSLLAFLTNNVTTLSNNINDPITALASQLFHNIYMTMYTSIAIAVVLLISVNAGIVDFSRNMYIMSEDNLLYRRLGEVHGRYRTPYLSIIISSIIAALFVAPGSVELIAGSYGIASTIVYLLAMLSLMIFRNKEVYLLRHFRTPGITISHINIPIVSITGVLVYVLAIALIFTIRPIYLAIVMSWLLVGLGIYHHNKLNINK